jgi:hypothetical protein
VLHRYHFLTFSELITLAVTALDDPETFARVHGPLRHLIVDEYQDINPAQERLIERLAAPPVELCVVGDDDQAIYLSHPLVCFQTCGSRVNLSECWGHGRPSSPWDREPANERGSPCPSLSSPNSCLGLGARINKAGMRRFVMTNSAAVYVGIDVSKSHLDVAALPNEAAQRFDHTEAGMAQLVHYLSTLRPSLVVLEATGGLETALTAALAAACLPVAVVNPRQVRDFAKALGRLAKTDALDAEVIARFAAAVQATPRPLRDSEALDLEALLVRRRQLLDMLGAAPRCKRELAVRQKEKLQPYIRHRVEGSLPTLVP